MSPLLALYGDLSKVNWWFDYRPVMERLSRS